MTILDQYTKQKSSEHLKAEELVSQFKPYCGVYGKRIINAKECAVMCVDRIIEAIEHFGYAGCIFDSFFDKGITNTDDEDPCQYWIEVKRIIQEEL